MDQRRKYGTSCVGCASVWQLSHFSPKAQNRRGIRGRKSLTEGDSSFFCYDGWCRLTAMMCVSGCAGSCDQWGHSSIPSQLH